MSNEKKVIEQNAKALKSYVGLSLSIDECRSFVTTVINHYKANHPELSQPEKTMQSWKHKPTEKDKPYAYLLNGSFIFASDVKKPFFDDDDTVVELYNRPKH